MEKIILRNQDIPDIGDIEVYERSGGYVGLKRAVQEMTPDQVTDAVKASGLKGRGGAGFPTGMKWSFLPKGVFPRYLVVNADESEPGTFKDREIMEKNPHQFIEGVIISAYAIQCNHAFVYIRGEYPVAAQILEKTIRSAKARGYAGEKVLGTDYNLEITVHRGAGAYICGEETALLDSLEGKLGMPRVKPPFPAAVGLYSKPTVINNVETLANIPPIIEKGADWYKAIGTERSTGPKIFCVSGHVNRPGNYEAALGSITLRDLIFGSEFAQGVRNSKKVKAILTAGASAPMLTEQHLDTKLDYEAIAAAGSILGSASIIVLDEDTDIPWAAQKMIEFFKHESCGKCTPCREGTYWLLTLLKRINTGEGSYTDVEMLSTVTSQMTGRTLCPLGDFATSPVTGSLKWFKPEYEAKVKANGDGHA